MAESPEQKEIKEVKRILEDHRRDFGKFQSLILTSLVPRAEIDKRQEIIWRQFDRSAESRKTMFWGFISLSLGLMGTFLGAIYFIVGAIT